MATIYPRNGRWHISYYLPNGRRIQRSTKIPLEQKKLAEAYLKQIEVGLARGNLGWENNNVTPITTAAKKWINSIKSRNTKNTYIRYHVVLNHFLSFIGTKFPDHRALEDITPEIVQSFISARSEINHPNTVRYQIRVLISWINFCIKMGWMASNPFKSTYLPKKIESHIRFFSPDEVIRIFDSTPPHRRDLWEFLYRTGSRIGETSKLKVQDVSFQRNVILYPPTQTKAKRPDEVEIADKLLPIMHRLCDGKSPDDLVFSDAPKWGTFYESLRKEFRTFLASLDPPIKKAGLHTWRHTTASALVSTGVPLVVVMRILRHKNIQTTMKYAHLAPDACQGILDQLPV